MSGPRPFVAAFFIGLVSAVAGLFLVGWLADQCVRWYRVSSFEGGSGYFIVVLALGGAIAGFVIGVVCGWTATRRTDGTFLRGLGLALAVDVGLVALATGLAYMAADHPPTIDGRALVVEVELMTPEGPMPADDDDFRPSMSVMTMDGRSSGYAVIERGTVRAEGSRWIVPAALHLGTSVAQKRVWVNWIAEDSLYFPLPIGSRPSEADFAWSNWRRPSHLHRDGAWIEGDALPDFSIRTRVQFAPPPVPPPTDAELAAARDAREAEALAAVPDDAPLDAWLPFTRVEVSEARRADVRARIAVRPDLAADVRALALGDDEKLAAAVLRLVVEMPDAASAWRDAVRAAGPDLVERTRKGITITEADDPGYEWAAALSIRFSAWLHAARIVRDRFGDDVSADVRTILDLARQRPDSYVMRQDIVRVAGFYLEP